MMRCSSFANEEIFEKQLILGSATTWLPFPAIGEPKAFDRETAEVAKNAVMFLQQKLIGRKLATNTNWAPSVNWISKEQEHAVPLMKKNSNIFPASSKWGELPLFFLDMSLPKKPLCFDTGLRPMMIPPSYYRRAGGPVRSYSTLPISPGETDLALFGRITTAPGFINDQPNYRRSL